MGKRALDDIDFVIDDGTAKHSISYVVDEETKKMTIWLKEEASMVTLFGLAFAFVETDGPINAIATLEMTIEQIQEHRNEQRAKAKAKAKAEEDG